MKLKNKLRAFTLMEVTVAMLIAAIGIAITFSAFRLVTSSYLQFSKKQERLSDFITLDKVLKQDFSSSQNIVKSLDGIAIQSDGGIINYKISDDFIFRDQFSLRLDTFKIKVEQQVYLFESKTAEQDSIIDQLNLNVQIDNEMIPLRYQKIYSAQNLFH